MKTTIISFIISLLITILFLNSCCEQPSNSYGVPQTTFKEELNKALEESNKMLEDYKTTSNMGRFQLYDVLPDSTKIYRNMSLFVIISPSGDVEVAYRN